MAMILISLDCSSSAKESLVIRTSVISLKDGGYHHDNQGQLGVAVNARGNTHLYLCFVLA